MAGIGFTLKKMFRDETYSNRGKAYLYSALVAAGPWIAAVLTMNIVVFLMDFIIGKEIEKEIFMGTVVYSFIFSQILTGPWQLLITRYISDKLYLSQYEYIRPSFMGLTKIIFFSGFIISIIYYYNKDIPTYYKLMAIYLFVIISMIWVLMVYLSAVKNYELIAKAYIYGGLLSIILTIIFVYNPLPFKSIIYASNILFSYLVGISLTFTMLMHNFLSTFYRGNGLQFDFIRYLNKYSSLFYIGLFYTLGLWIDDILMWFSKAAVNIYDTYWYAPIYDNAVFLAYLTIIPTMVLFLVTVETDFYDTYKKYYGLANGVGTYEEINIARKEMIRSIYRQIAYIFEIQIIITATIILLSKPIFKFLNISILIRDIFRVCALGALSNILVLIVILVLLYFEARKRALLISFVFLISNATFTLFFMTKGIDYYGYGFFAGSLIAYIVSLLILAYFIRNINYKTFALQPLFQIKDKGIFVSISDMLNKYYKKRNGRVSKFEGIKPKIYYIEVSLILIFIIIYYLIILTFEV